VPNQWNIQTFTISLLTFDQFWGNFARQGIDRGMTPKKVFISFYSLPQNSEKSANNCLHAKPVKYSNFYVSLQMFDQFWCNSARQSIFAFQSWWVTKSLRMDAKCVKYSNFYDIFANVWLIVMIFYVARRICLLELMSNQK